MLYAHYNEETGKILGFYTLDRNSHIPKPNVQVTDDTRKRVIKNPKMFCVSEGKVIEIKDFEPNFSEESVRLQHIEDMNGKLAESIKVGEHRYIFDEFTQRNIILSYIALNADRKSAKLWCMNRKDEWEFKSHSKREIERLADAFTTLRENESVKLHSKLESTDSESN